MTTNNPETRTDRGLHALLHLHDSLPQLNRTLLHTIDILDHLLNATNPIPYAIPIRQAKDLTQATLIRTTDLYRIVANAMILLTPSTHHQQKEKTHAKTNSPIQRNSQPKTNGATRGPGESI